MKPSSDVDGLSGICFSYADNRLDGIKARKLKFAHYTSAATGLKILRGQEIWLRNAGVMNDFSEISYGLECLKYSAEQIKLIERLEAIIAETHPQIWESLLDKYENISRQSNTDMFMFSICEHADPSDLGKLSMWRAYGGGAAGVCIVIDSELLLAFEEHFDISLSPVLYGTPDDFKDQMEIVVGQLEANLDIVARTPPDKVDFVLTKALRSAVLSTKHPGFREEQEWRLIHLPKPGDPPIGIRSDIECINDIPQVVYKMRSGSPRDSRTIFDRLLDKVIIGPTTYPHTVVRAFTKVLEDQGVPDAAGKVVLSDIPLRQKN